MLYIQSPMCGTDAARLTSQAVCILALLGLLALSAPAADARQLKQTAITDADILNFALNLEVCSSTIAEPPHFFCCSPVLLDDKVSAKCDGVIYSYECC